TIGAGEVIDDDLYVAGSTVTVDGTIRGDLFAAGMIVTVNGTVEGSLFAAAQTVIVNGTVRDGARVAGQAVLVDSKAKIGRDLLFAGYSLESRPGSAVGRDLLGAGYQALLAGDLARNLRGAFQGLELRGTVGGDAEVEVGARQGGGSPY